MMQPIPCLPGDIEPSQLVQVRSIFLHDVTDALVNFIFKYYRLILTLSPEAIHLDS